MFGRKAREQEMEQEARGSNKDPFGGERFACRPRVTTYASAQHSVISFGGVPGAREVDQDLVNLMDELQIWGSFGEQLARLEATGINLNAQELAHALERMRPLGALWREGDLLEALRAQPAREAAPPRHILWCTRDRTPLLARSMESILGAAAGSEPLRVSVLDDSADRSAEEASRAVIRGLSSRAGARSLDFRYIGRKERTEIAARIADRAAREGVSRECVEFILGGGHEARFRVGANRNLGMLLTAGEAYLSADDDTLAVGARGSETAGLELSSLFNPTVSELFRTDEECGKLAGAEAFDLPAEHGRYLGKGVGEIIAESGGRLGLSTLSSASARGFLLDPGEIVITAAGALGDSGLSSLRIVFHLDGEARGRYVENQDTYADARLARFVFRRAERPTITGSHWLVTMGYAMDNREIVPPTFPFGRNCDGLLGTMLRLCRPSAYILHLPLAVRHQPPPRPFTENDLHGYLPRIVDFMVDAAEGVQMSRFVRSAEERMHAVAAHLRGIAELAPADFAEVVRSIWMSSANRYLQNLQTRLDRYRYSPPEWAEDIISHSESLLSFLEGEQPLLPVELTGDGSEGADPAEQLAAFRRSVALYAEALDAWPLLREIAGSEGIAAIGA